VEFLSLGGNGAGTPVRATITSFTRSAATVLGREITRSVFGVGKRR
jgi:hypothetical protein